MVDSLRGQIRKEKIKKLTANWEEQQQMFLKHKTQLENFGKATFIISSELAKLLKPFAEGQFIERCLLEVYSVLCPKKECILKN